MLELLDNLPNSVSGVRATGKVTTDDYERVFNPLMEAAHREGRRVRLLYEVPPEFKGFTAGAGLEDMRMGMKYLRLFERCAVVTDVGWLRDATRLFGAMMPCPVKVFPNAERAQAIAWLGAPVLSTVQHRLLPDIGVLVIEPSQPLGAEDFDAIAATVNPWIDARAACRGSSSTRRSSPAGRTSMVFFAISASFATITAACRASGSRWTGCWPMPARRWQTRLSRPN